MTVTERIGRYRLLGVSGTGTFATVHRAEDERLGDVVAIKVLAENHSLDPEVRERFLREGRALRRIASPHVVAVHDLGETERQQPYLVMQYADRGTLARRVAELRRSGWAPAADDVRDVATSLAEAIAATHRAQIVHRDLSPNNVLVRSIPDDGGAPDRPTGDGPRLVQENEQLVLADLGLCKDLARHSGLTAAGGTDGFRPPEQRAGSGFVAPAADLWSLSALIVWLITGEPPNDDDGVSDRIVAAGLPRALGDVLDVGLARDPDARPADAARWLEAIEVALRRTPAPDHPSDDDRVDPDSDVEAEGVDPDSDVAAEGGGAHRRASPPTPAERRRRALQAAVASRRGRLVLAGGVVVLVVVLLSVLALPLGGGVQRTALADGQILLERSAGEVTLGVAGPEEVVEGQRAVFLARDEGFVVTVWIAPDGVPLVDRPSLSFTTGSPGVASVQLVGVTREGEVVRIQHDLRVRQADDP